MATATPAPLLPPMMPIRFFRYADAAALPFFAATPFSIRLSAATLRHAAERHHYV